MKIYLQIKKALIVSAMLLFFIAIRTNVSAQASTCPAENTLDTALQVSTNQNYSLSYNLSFIEQQTNQDLVPCSTRNTSCVEVRGCILNDLYQCGILAGYFTPSGQVVNENNQLTFTRQEISGISGGSNLKYWLIRKDQNGSVINVCQDYFVKARDQVIPHVCDPGTFSNPVVQGSQSQNVTFIDPFSITYNKSMTHNFVALGQYRVEIKNQNTGTTIASIPAVGELNGSGNLELRDLRSQNGSYVINFTAQPAGLYNIYIVDAGSVAQRCGPYPFSVQDENNSIPDVDINDGSTDTGQPAQSYEIETCNNGDGIVTSLGCVPTNPSELFAAILRLAIGLAGGIAFLLIILGGVRILASAGNPEALNQGREIVTSAIAGLILIIFSVFILRFIGVDILAIPGLSKDGSSSSGGSTNSVSGCVPDGSALAFGQSTASCCNKNALPENATGLRYCGYETPVVNGTGR